MQIDTAGIVENVPNSERNLRILTTSLCPNCSFFLGGSAQDRLLVLSWMAANTCGYSLCRSGRH